MQNALKRHLRFGLALQAGQFICLAKDSITPVFVGLYLGAAKMGYANLGRYAGELPYNAANASSAPLPSFSSRAFNLDHHVELRRYTAHAMWMTNAIAAPLMVFTAALAYPITVLVFSIPSG